MNYTYNDFIMESAMVETTNSTGISDITMEQWYAEFNVACAAFDAYNKYSVIAEYAQCDIDEFVQESKYGPDASTKLTGKIAKVEEWGNEGGTAKKIASKIAAGALKIIRAVVRFFSKLFGGAKNGVTAVADKLKSFKNKHTNPEKAQAREDKKNAKLAAKQMNDPEYLAEGEKNRANIYADQVSGLEKQVAEQAEKILSYGVYVEKLNTKIAEQNKIIEQLKNANEAEVNALLDRLHKCQDDVAELKNIINSPHKYMAHVKVVKAVKNGKPIQKISDKEWEGVVDSVHNLAEPMKNLNDNLKKNEILMEDVNTNAKTEKARVEAAKATQLAAQKGFEVLKACGFVQNDQGVYDFAKA